MITEGLVLEKHRELASLCIKYGVPLKESLSCLKAQTLEIMYEKCGSWETTARLLGVSRRVVYYVRRGK